MASCQAIFSFRRKRLVVYVDPFIIRLGAGLVPFSSNQTIETGKPQETAGVVGGCRTIPADTAVYRARRTHATGWA